MPKLSAKQLKTKIGDFFAGSESKLIFAMFFPILIEQFILVFMGTAHSLMLARINENAEYVVSAVSLVEQINQLTYALLGSVPIGATVVVSQYIGAGRVSSAKATAEQAVMLGVGIALLTTAIFIVWGQDIFVLFLGEDKAVGITFTYSMRYMRWNVLSYPLLNIGSTAAGIIRGMGDTKSPMRISIVIGVVNVAVAGFCIYALDMNVVGAGVASIVARFFGAVVAVRLLVKKGFIERFSNLFRPKVLYIKQIMFVGVFQSVENLIFQFGRTLTYRYFSGEIDIAANSVTGSIFNLASAPGNSMSIVAMALVGRLTGAGDKKRSYVVLRNIVLLSMAMLLLTNLLFLPLSPFFISLYTGKFEPAKLAAISSRIYQLIVLNVIFMPLFWSPSFVMFAGMKGAGDVKFTMVVSIVSMWAVRVLFAYLLGGLLGMGVVGVWLGMFFDWILRGVLGAIRFKSKKWQKKSVAYGDN